MFSQGAQTSSILGYMIRVEGRVASEGLFSPIWMKPLYTKMTLRKIITRGRSINGAGNGEDLDNVMGNQREVLTRTAIPTSSISRTSPYTTTQIWSCQLQISTSFQ